MNQMPSLNRRHFVIGTAAVGAGLALGLALILFDVGEKLRYLVAHAVDVGCRHVFRLLAKRFAQKKTPVSSRSLQSGAKQATGTRQLRGCP